MAYSKYLNDQGIDDVETRVSCGCGAIFDVILVDD